MTPIQDIELYMTSKGYGIVASCDSGKEFHYSKRIFHVVLHCVIKEVYKDDWQVQITYNGLMMNMYINSGFFAFDHPGFDKFEFCILAYALMCQEINPLKL